MPPVPLLLRKSKTYLAVLGGETKASRDERLRVAREFGGTFVPDSSWAAAPPSATPISPACAKRPAPRGCGSRLTVDQAGALSQLPWEYLRDPSSDFLALSRRTPIVRYTPQLDVRPPATITLPLRVLVMISAPQGLPALDVEGEWQRLQDRDRSAASARFDRAGTARHRHLDRASASAARRGIPHFPLHRAQRLRRPNPAGLDRLRE